MHVDRPEAGAIEGGRHLHLPVHALLAQHRHLRPRAAIHERRRDVLGGIEREMRIQPRIALVEDAVVFLVGA